jgi:hypothetical protein
MPSASTACGSCSSLPVLSTQRLVLAWHAAGTPYNRRTLLLAAASRLQPLAALGPFSPADCHNMLTLLCPDLPLSVVRNAWAAATELARQQPREFEDDTASAAAPAMAGSSSSSSSQQQAGAGDALQAEQVPLSALLSALAPVMIYEQWLLMLRDRCFTEDRTCGPPALLPAQPAASVPLAAWLSCCRTSAVHSTMLPH